MRNKIYDYAKGLCEEHNCELIYLTLMGSRLYGTATPASDYDVKGVMLPNYTDVLCGRYTHNIRRKPEQNPLEVDLELYSIQEYFKLLQTGETISTDMLFAFTYPEAIIFAEAIFSVLFQNFENVIDGKNLDKNPYLRYAYSQAVKYGIKGNRYEVIKKVLDLAEILYGLDTEENKKLGDYLTPLEITGGNQKYCFITEAESHRKQKIPSLYLAGKVHQGTIKLGEFVRRCKSLLNDYGNRAKLAAEEGGNDWKALSHAVRAVCQLNELLRTGMVRFPRAEAEFLRQIKEGLVPFDQVKETIEHNIKFFDEAVKVSIVTQKYRWRQKFVDQFIILIYKNHMVV